MNTKKLIVTNNFMDMFFKGYFTIEKGYNNKFDQVQFYNSVFSVDGKFESDGYFFNCGYGGTGPTNLVKFLQEQTGRSESELKNLVFRNDIVEYDFSTQEISVSISKLPQKGNFKVLANKDGKLIFCIEKIRNNEVIANIISEIYRLMKNTKWASDIKEILYIGDNKSEEHKFYSYQMFGSRNYYNFILIFEDFEIWSACSFGYDYKTILYNDRFQEMLNDIGIQLNNPKYKNEFLKSFDRFIAKINNCQSNEVINVE